MEHEKNWTKVKINSNLNPPYFGQHGLQNNIFLKQAITPTPY